MRNALAVLMALVVAAALGAGFYLVRSSLHNRAQVRAAREEADKTAQALKVERSQRQVVEKERDQLIQIADKVGQELRKAISNGVPVPPSETAPPKPDEPLLGKLVSRMMSDPDTRKFIREQQRSSVEQLYEPLVKKLGLSAEEGTEFKRLLFDRIMAGSEKAMSLMGSQNDEEKAKAINNLAEDQKNSEEEIRSFLGESRYSEYKSYQETVGERTQLNMFRQADAAGKTLTEDQTDRLLAIMAEEKRVMQEQAGAVFPGASQDPAAMEAVLKSGQSEKLIEAQELLNQRVSGRAADLLSRDQMEAFARFQTNQLQMMQLGLKMAQQMFGK